MVKATHHDDERLGGSKFKREHRRAPEMASHTDTETSMVDRPMRRAEPDLGLVLDRISELIAIHDTEMRIVWANEAAGASMGLDPEALTGRRCYEIWHQRSEPCPGCPVRLALTTGKPSEAAIAGVDGRHWFIKGYALRDAAGEITGAVEITVDMTEHKKAEDALVESRQKYSNLFQYSSDAIFVHDQDGKILDVNQKALDMTGYGRSEILSLGMSELHPPEGPDRRTPAPDDIQESGFVTFETDFLRKDGTVFQAEVSSGLFEIRDSRVIQSIVRDITERKRAEEALTRSEEQHRSLVENIDEIIFTLDTKGRFTYISPVLNDVLGYSPAEIIGKPFNCFVHPDDAPGLLVTLERGLDGTQKADEIRVLDKHGETHFVRMSCRPNNDGERLVGLTGIMADITESKLARAILRESEEMYATLVRTTTDGVTVTDLQCKITEVSPRFLQLHGYDRPEELVGRSSFELIAPEDHRRALQNMKTTLKEGSLRRTEYTMIRKDGSQFIGETDAALIRDAFGNAKGFISTTRDITEKKRAEQALRRSEQRFRDIAENTSEWIWEVDAQGIYTYASPVIRKMLGYEPEEVLGRHFYELHPPDQRDKEKETVFSVFAGKKPFREYRHSVLRKDGTVARLSTTGVPILNEDGDLLGYRGADTFVPAEGQAAGELEDERDRLARTLEALEDGVVATGSDGNVVIFNRSAGRLTGRHEQDAVGGPLSAVLPLETDTGSADLFAEVWQSKEGARLSGTGLLATASGDTIRIGYSAAKILDDKNEVSGIVIIFRKICED
jgi:PAS domain S-box-containing protein